jgi:hypothetical protein
MKFGTSAASFALLWALVCRVFAPVAAEECTHGKLFLTDSTSMKVVSIALDDNVTDLVVTEMPSSVTLDGSPPLVLNHVVDSLVLTAAYVGSEEQNMTDGVVNLIHTGVELETQGEHTHIHSDVPYKIVNAEIGCGPAYHPHSGNGLLVVQCDGSNAAQPSVNTTVLVFDESKLSSSANDSSAILAEYKLAGSHHGAALPVDDGVILHSLATADIINGVANASSLPEGFQVVDYQGTVMKQIADPTDPNMSCFDFHGSAHLDDTYYFACSRDLEEHGGVLIVEYNDDSQDFTTRHVKYPNDPDLPNHRAGGIAAHHDNPYIVTDFADWDAEGSASHLWAFEATATESSDDGILNLGSVGHCEYGFEQANGEWVVVLLKDLSVQVYEPGPSWTKVAEVKLEGEPYDECPWPGPLAVGYMQAFVFRNKTLYVLDLEHVEHDGTIGVSSLDLGFDPYSMTIAGVPEGYACGVHQDHSDHDEDHHDEDDHDEDGDGDSDEESGAASANDSSAGATTLMTSLHLCISALSMWAVAVVI